MKKMTKKLCSLFMIVGMLFQSFSPMIVIAETIYQDGDLIELEFYSRCEGNKIIYENGYVTLTKNGDASEGSMVDLNEGDEVVITLYPNEGYTAKLHDNVRDYDIALVDNKYSFTIGIEKNATLRFKPSFTIEGQETGLQEGNDVTYDFTINGVSFTDVKNGDVLSVEDDFTIGELNSFYVTKIDVEGDRTYNYDLDEYSTRLVDSQGRQILETNFTKISDNAGVLRVLAHNEDIVQDDCQPGKTPEDFYGFYITDIYIVKDAFRGVEVSTSVMPDNYDFTSWNGVDLSETSEKNPGNVTVYYGEDTIKLEAPLSGEIKKITVLGDIPENAYEIDDEANKVTIYSNFYNEIPLKIELEDGTIGYINVTRIGLFITGVNAGSDTLYHGAAFMGEGNLNKYTDKNRIAAVFYHEDYETYENYELIANLTYEDGTTETVVAEGVGDVHNSNGNITGSDYIIWKGENNAPVKVSVTVVYKDALNDENTFGGAAFGTGAGVTWENIGR